MTRVPELSLVEKVVEGSPYALIAVKPPGEVVLWSSAAGSLFGYSRDEAIGSQLSELIVPEDRLPEAREAVETALRKGQIVLDTVRRRKDGTPLFVEVSMKTLCTPAGGPQLIVVGTRDIARRMSVEAALSASEERYRCIVETAAEGVWTIDRDNRTDYINRRGAAILGYTVEELLGRNPMDFVFPEDLHDARRRLMLRRQGIQEEADERLRRRDDSEVWVHSVTTPLAGDLGEYLGSLAMFSDITGHKKTFDAILKLSSIVQHSNDAIISETLDGTIESWNDAATRLYGYPPEEAIGRHISILIPPERYHEPFEFLKRIRRGELVEHYDTVRRRKDGRSIDISQTMSPVRDANNVITGASVIARDITGERLLREQLDAVARQRAEDLQRFVTSVQHAQEEERQRISRELHDDLGQRMTGLKLKIEMLEDDATGSSAEFIAAFTAVKKEIDSMISEVRRISANLRPSALDDFGLVVALQLLCRDFEKMSGLQVDFHADVLRQISKHVDIALYRIAQEALSNIARHAEARSVSVQITQDDEVVGLLIEDDGKGFEPTRLRGSDGARGGLGLISMRERAQQFGGSLYVTSSPNRGTKLRIEIPHSTLGIYETNQNTYRR